MPEIPETPEQWRANHAWQRACQWDAGKTDGKYSEEALAYARQVKRMSARILTAGLGQALSFLAAKGKLHATQTSSSERGAYRLFQDLSGWVLSERVMGGAAPVSTGTNLLTAVIEKDFIFLRRTTQETLLYLNWLQRFLEAKGIKAEDAEEND